MAFIFSEAIYLSLYISIDPSVNIRLWISFNKQHLFQGQILICMTWGFTFHCKMYMYFVRILAPIVSD